jgi:hypothetical protein
MLPISQSQMSKIGNLFTSLLSDPQDSDLMQDPPTCRVTIVLFAWRYSFDVRIRFIFSTAFDLS